MTVDDFIYDPATELGWFSLSESKRLLQAAKDKGLIVERNGLVEIDFDYASVGFPVGFKPSKKVLKSEKEEPLFPTMLKEVIENNNISKSEIMAEVNKKQDKLNIEVEVALLLVCEEKKIKIKDKKRYIGAIRKKIRGNLG